MEASWLAMVLWHPVGLAVLVGVVLISTLALYSSSDTAPINRWRLASGYGAAVLVCLVIAAVSSYIPEQESQQRWGVHPERYWDAVFGQFTTLAALLIYLTVFGIAVLGSPVVFALARRGYGNIPSVLIASVLISLLAAVAIAAVLAPGPHFGRDVAWVVSVHGLLALAFALGVGLPWRRQVTS